LVHTFQVVWVEACRLASGKYVVVEPAVRANQHQYAVVSSGMLHHCEFSACVYKHSLLLATL
jgi:hypothetical protein